MAVLIVVAWLAVPVSNVARIMDLEVGDMSLALSADGYWLALALCALMGSPRRFGRSSGSEGAIGPSTLTRGDR